MSQVKANQNDPRSRYTHQAYDVTYLGKAKETGPSGIASRLSATYQASILMTVDAGETAAQMVGDLTQGIWISGLVNHVALSAGTSVALELPAYGGEGAVTLVAAADVTAAGEIALDAPVWAPLPIDRPLTATVTGGTAGEIAVLSLLVTPAENGWK